MVPEHQRKYYEYKLKRNKYRLKITKVPALDEDIIPEKYYPMSFDEFDIPSIVLQGWWNKDIALKWWQYKLGIINITKHIFFIQGQEALDKNYRISKYVYYDKHKYVVRTKMQFPPEVQANKSRKSFKRRLRDYTGSDGSKKTTERRFFETLFSLLPSNGKAKFNRSAIEAKKYKENKERLKHRRKPPCSE